MKRILRIAAWTAGALAVIIVAGALALPALLDRPGMAAQIQAKLSSAIKGDVRWTDFDVRILPFPRGELRGLRVETTAATLSADEVDVALRLWPLIMGRAEITSLELARPVLRLTVVPAAAVPQEARLEQPDTLKAYRETMGAIVDALREFAPDTEVRVDGAEFVISVEGLPPLDFRNVMLHARTAARGVELQASAASRYWTSMKLAGEIRYDDLSSRADLRLTRVQGQAWLDWLLRSSGWRAAVPDVDLAARFSADASKALELELEGSAPTLTLSRGEQRFAASPIVLKGRVLFHATDIGVQLSRLGIGQSSLSAGSLRYSQADGSLAADAGFDLALAQLAGYAAVLAPAPMARLDSASGALRGRATFSLKESDWRASARIEKSDAALQPKALPGPLRIARATVEADPRGIRVDGAALSAPAGELGLSGVRYAFKDGSAAATIDYDLDVARTLELARAALPEEKRAAIDALQFPAGRARGSVKAGWRAKALAIENATLEVLDSKAAASARLTGFDRDLRVQGTLSGATLGPQLIDWAWRAAALPQNLAPQPLRLAAQGFAWGPKQALQLNAAAQFERGPALTADLAWSPQALELRRATIKDGRSDVTLALRSRGKELSGRYAGTLDSRSIAAMLKSAAAPAGAIQGTLEFTVDREQPRRSAVDGVLKGQNVDLSWLAGQPARLERLDLASDATGLRVNEATVDWAGQRATLRGAGRRTDAGPVIDAEIDSPGLVIDALLPKEKTEKEESEKGQAGADPWPLPVTGRVALRSKFIQYGIHKVEPLAATLSLEREKATLEVNEALICGLAVPLTVEATPSGVSARGVVFAQQQRLEDAARCLSGEKIALSGRLDLRVEMTTQGQPAELMHNLKGTIRADVRDGEMMKFALIGNILSMQNVAALVKEGGPKVGAEGFPFRQLSARGKLEGGRFMLEEGVFHSNAIGLGANGWISLADFQTRLTVLVAPLALLDETVRKLPVLGYVVGGTFTSLPVSVSGDIRDPTVVPLGPRAITNELTGILGRTLKLPGRLVPGEAKEP